MMTNDFVQIGVVAKNEIIKSVRGRKFLISTAIVFLVFLLITGLQMATNGWDDIKDIGQFMSVYFNMFPMVITLVVALLASVAIVSEFEERTALILLTKPIRRPTIVFGKFLASFAVGFATILLYLIVAIFFKAVGNGHIDGDLFAGMGVYLIYIMAITGVAMLVSAFAKKSSTSALLTLFMLLILPLILEAILGMKGLDTWFLLGSLGGAGADVISGGGEPFRDIAAMLVWLIVTMAGSIVLFKKRQF